MKRDKRDGQVRRTGQKRSRVILRRGSEEEWKGNRTENEIAKENDT